MKITETAQRNGAISPKRVIDRTKRLSGEAVVRKEVSGAEGKRGTRTLGRKRNKGSALELGSGRRRGVMNSDFAVDSLVEKPLREK